jgi:O-antigen ligase
MIKKYLFLVFAFFLPVSQKISTITIGLLLITSIITFRKKNFHFKIEAVLPVCLYALYCISLLYSSESEFSIIEKKASLLIFPLVFMVNKDFSKYFNFILKYFIFGCLVALILCEFYAFYNSLDFTNLIFDPRIEKSLSFYDSIAKEKNHFFSFNFSFIHQAVYFAMYLLFSISILLHANLFKNRIIKYSLFFFFLVGLFQILNKTSLAILFILLLFKIFKSIKSKRITATSTVVLVVTAVSIFWFNPRFQNFYQSDFLIDNSEIKIKDFRKIENTKPNDYNYRVMLWSSAFDLIAENPLIGIGGGGSDSRLYEVFAVKRQWYDKSEKYHAHNQYLQIFLDLGIMGLIVFFSIAFSIVKAARNNKNREFKYTFISVIIILGFNFLFESMLERYSGISFFSFLYCIIIFSNQNKDELYKQL